MTDKRQSIHDGRDNEQSEKTVIIIYTNRSPQANLLFFSQYTNTVFPYRWDE